MIIRHFEIKLPQTEPPEKEGWHPTWHGYWEMDKVETSERRAKFDAINKEIHEQRMITEEEFERDCLLNILSEIKHEQVTMFELGAGWGRMSLALAGVVDYRLVDMKPKDYFVVAVEAEKMHYDWLCEHLDKQNIKARAVYNIVGNGGGCWWQDSAFPDEEYGQRAFPSFSFKGLTQVLKLKSANVSFSVDEMSIILKKKLKSNHIDIVDVDVQGTECDVVKGAMGSIKAGKIDYWMLGTHHPKYNDKLIKMLSPYYEVVVNIYPNSISHVGGFKPIKVHDGIQVYKRKGLA